MGHKKVCFSCRKAFSIDNTGTKPAHLPCPECGKGAFFINHKFRPPKSSDIKGWKLAEYLKDNGFFFDHAYELVARGTYLQVPYPTSMEQAIAFVKKQLLEKSKFK